MALGGSHLRRSPCRNLLPTNPLEDELARDPGPVRGPHSGNTFPAPSCNPILALIPILVPTLISALATTNNLLKKFMKVYLEMNQGPKQLLAEYKQSFQAKVPELYNDKLHMDCYHFCQQCKDHFQTAGFTGTNRNPFAALFLRGNINVHWA